MNKNIKNILYTGCLALTLTTSLSSCEDYLDKSPEATVSSEDAFKTFKNFQGFIEEIYNCVPDKVKCNYCPSWNWGDDEVFNSKADGEMTHQMDLGNFRNIYENGYGTWFYCSGSNPTSINAKSHSIYPHAWYCIRKCNLGLANLDKLTTATQEEKNLIAGQLYFFRAWWHFEMMQQLGGLPYIDQVLDASSKLTLPRLSYQECAAKAGEDFRKAADLLPIDWDKTTAGKQTSGHNQLRINKIMALGYLGKNYLWAASPLMKNGAKLGAVKSEITYDYDAEYSKKAAEALGELLNLVEGGQTQYALASYNYDDIYNHVISSSESSSFDDIFYTVNQNYQMPGSTEAIFRGPCDENKWASPWNHGKLFGPKMNGIVPHDNVIHQPTANLVEAYGMANGEPAFLIENGKLVPNLAGGFDPEHPWKNRDPRFYHDIVYDGCKFINDVGSAAGVLKNYIYCNLSSSESTTSDGMQTMRSVVNGSQTGYFIQKLVPHTANSVDQYYDKAFNAYLPYMRLADIYLMYAEACAATSGAQGKSSNFSKTAEAAINTIRDRCGAGHVAAEYVANAHKFMDEVRREREVELAFEGMRFNDLQRWLLLTEAPYNTKYEQVFERVSSDPKHPEDGQVSGYGKKVIIKRDFTAKHYWFPFPTDQTQLYAEFPQNPGW